MGVATWIQSKHVVRIAYGNLYAKFLISNCHSCCDLDVPTNRADPFLFLRYGAAKPLNTWSPLSQVNGQLNKPEPKSKPFPFPALPRLLPVGFPPLRALSESQLDSGKGNAMAAKIFA